MGWTYEYRIAYGITVNAWDNPGLKELLDNLKHVINYDDKMSLGGTGTLFIYQTIKIDHGSYSLELPNIEGDIFSPPKHPIIHRIDEDLSRPRHSIDEILAMREIKMFCKTRGKGAWIRHSYILYS